MVKVTGPMMSMDASGTLANTATFAKWKGRNYVRSRVIPANPKSAGQTGMRAAFKFLSQIWASINAPTQASWAERAAAKAISPFNEFVSYNQLRIRDFKGPTYAYPEDTADTPATLGALSAAAGERTITVTQAITTADDGWAILFFRSTSASFTPNWENLVAIKALDGTNDVILIDGPLDPDTYYYDTCAVTKDGQLSAETGEEEVTLT